MYVEGRFDWDQLQHRMAPARRGQRPAGPPASYVAFDLLALAGHDLRDRPLRERWAGLQQLASAWRPPLQLVLQTDDKAEALEWFEALRDAGVEGLVAKPAASRYLPGSRSGWRKIKNRETGYAVVGAVIGPVDRPQAIVLGRYTEAAELVIVGRSVALDPRLSAAVAAAVVPVEGAAHPWPARIPAGYAGGGSIELSHVRPDLVVEVSADGALQNGRWRHGVRLARLRPDLTADQTPRHTG